MSSRSRRRLEQTPLASRRGTSYLPAMSVLRYFSVPRAYRDVKRLLLTRRKPYEIWFLLLAMTLTLAIVLAFVHDSRPPPRPYHEDIIYMQSWPLSRSEAEILAQQKIDAAKKAERQAEIDRADKERQAQYQRLNNEVSGWL